MVNAWSSSHKEAADGPNALRIDALVSVMVRSPSARLCSALIARASAVSLRSSLSTGTSKTTVTILRPNVSARVPISNWAQKSSLWRSSLALCLLALSPPYSTISQNSTHSGLCSVSNSSMLADWLLSGSNNGTRTVFLPAIKYQLPVLFGMSPSCQKGWSSASMRVLARMKAMASTRITLRTFLQYEAPSTIRAFQEKNPSPDLLAGCIGARASAWSSRELVV